MEPSPPRNLVSLPKAHLHCHLEGAMRASTLSELCQRYGIDRPADTRGRSFDNFGGFVDMYWAACNSIRARDDLARLIMEVAEDAADEGVWWIEPAYDVARYSTLRDGTPHRLFATQEEGWHFAIEAAERASRATHVGIGFISAVDRVMSAEHAIERALATKNIVSAGAHVIDGRMPGFSGRYAAIVGFGLHGNEGGCPPDPFVEAFAIGCGQTGLLSVPHAGEIALSPGDGPASVRGALDLLAAERIAHGVLAIEDPDLVRRLVDEQVCLDVCPTSNLLLRVFPSAAAHPLPRLLEVGVACTLGSDDPLLFGPNLVDEFTLCRDAMGISDEDLAAMARTSFLKSGAPDEAKRAGRAAIDAWFT